MVEKEMRYEPESVLEPPRDRLQVPHPSSTSGLSALGLLTPLVRPQLSTGVTALRAFCQSQSRAIRRVEDPTEAKAEHREKGRGKRTQSDVKRNVNLINAAGDMKQAG